LGETVFDLDDWKVIGEYVYDSEGGRHQAFYSPKRDLQYMDIHLKAEERIQVEQSLKYSAEEAQTMFDYAGLKEAQKWTASSENYSE
jgi:uncharacterized SAM-dependent methyltransferase